jgi:hypothetical protein
MTNKKSNPLSPAWQDYEKLVQALVAAGMSRSDAQGVVDAEDLKSGRDRTVGMDGRVDRLNCDIQAIESQYPDADESIQKHIVALKAIFPEAFVAPTEEFDGHKGGMWTNFGETGGDYGGPLINYWDHTTNPRLQKYLDKNDLFAEPNDPGTYMIWSGDGRPIVDPV